MRTTTTRTILTLLMTALLCGCSDRRGDAPLQRVEAAVRMAEDAPLPHPMSAAKSVAQAPAHAVTGGNASDPGSALDGMAAQRRLVRTGSLTVEVDDVESASRAVEALAEEQGGFVAGLNGSLDHAGRRSSVVTIRVEPMGFMRAVEGARRLGVVRHETVDVEDVGKAYADIESRIRTKEAAAGRMREIMATRTGSLEDVVSAEHQLTALLEQIEQLEGQRRYYDRQLALSTLSVTLTEHAPAMAIAGPGIEVLAPVAAAVRAGAEHLVVLVSFVIYATVLIGPWIALAALAYTLVRRSRRRIAKA